MRPVRLVPALSFVVACGAPGGTDVRSPSRDYPPPPAHTSDGEVLGADRVAPGDKLDTGPRAGSGGVKPAESPGPERRQPPR
jgi:hypothetical protein